MRSYLKTRVRGALILLFCALLFAFVFWLYALPWQAALYAAVLCAALLLIYGVFDFLKFQEKRARLQALKSEVALTLDRLPTPRNPVEADYQALLTILRDDGARKLAECAARYDGAVDYFTLWAHQIKTPIAASRLLLQEGDADPRALSDELFKIEQYVEMALCYLKLDGGPTDYVFREVDLDDVIRQALRKYAPQFIRRKIALSYEPVKRRALTDEKWLLFVIEQVLSNALKYTSGGSISIRLEEPVTLVISDTGIGIEPEDLPRVFEKGYTGLNGRYDKRATGIGLYLCRRIMAALGHGIRIQSTVGKGTTVRLDLDTKPVEGDSSYTPVRLRGEM